MVHNMKRKIIPRATRPATWPLSVIRNLDIDINCWSQHCNQNGLNCQLNYFNVHQSSSAVWGPAWLAWLLRWSIGVGMLIWHHYIYPFSSLLRHNIELYKVTRNHKVTFCFSKSQVMPDQSSKIDIMCNLADVSLFKWFSCRSWWGSWQDKIFQFHPWDYQFIINQSVEGINVNISCLVHWGPWVNAVLGNNANNIKIQSLPCLSSHNQW